MTLYEFAIASDISGLSELEKVLCLAYFFRKTESKDDFLVTDVFAWFRCLHLATPNGSRLKSNLTTSRAFIKGKMTSSFKIELKKYIALDKKYSPLLDDQEAKTKTNHVLDSVHWSNTRGYIETLAKQINGCFENNFFDGCAVMMRRLMEVLLILAYRKLGIDSEIKDSSGNYFMLERICANATNNTTLALSRDSKTALGGIRDLGNYSAHKIEYTAKKSDVERVIGGFRIIIEELMFKSGLRT